MWEIPLVESLKILFKKGNRSLSCLYGILLILLLFIVSINFVSSTRSLIMRKFHPGAQSFGRWALCQLVPSMYNFKNEILISPQSLPLDFRGHVSLDLVRFTVNHYPMRMIYFNNSRLPCAGHSPYYVYLRSKFRGHELISSYVVQISKQYTYITKLNFYEYSSRE